MIKSLLLALVFAVTPSAFALWEIRVDLETYERTPKAFNAQMQDFVRGAPELKGPVGAGLDGVFRLPALPLMVGLRHEALGFEGSGRGTISGASVDTSTKFVGSRDSVFAGWDILGLPIGHLSLVASYAFQQKMKYTMSSKNAGGSVHEDSFTGVMQPGFGAGLEAGFKVAFVVFATELGYTVYKTKEFTSNGKTAYDGSGKKIQADLSGGYWRVMAGVGF